MEWPQRFAGRAGIGIGCRVVGTVSSRFYGWRKAGAFDWVLQRLHADRPRGVCRPRIVLCDEATCALDNALSEARPRGVPADPGPPRMQWRISRGPEALPSGIAGVSRTSRLLS
jgi:ABC-type phosphonate transport system ATPase subunit